MVKLRSAGGRNIRAIPCEGGGAFGGHGTARGWLLIQLGLAATAWAIIAGLLSLAA